MKSFSDAIGVFFSAISIHGEDDEERSTSRERVVTDPMRVPAGGEGGGVSLEAAGTGDPRMLSDVHDLLLTTFRRSHRAEWQACHTRDSL
jgi:hypothetical protein